MPTIAELIVMKKQERGKLDETIRKLEEALALEQGGLVGDAGEKMTTLHMAELVLERAAGHQLHTAELAREIEKQFGRFVKPSSLGTMLYRAAVEKKKRFVKVKGVENTYQLMK